MTPVMTQEHARNQGIQVCTLPTPNVWSPLLHHTTVSENMCGAETDVTWMIMWGDTRAGYHDTQPCSGSISGPPGYTLGS